MSFASPERLWFLAAVPFLLALLVFLAFRRRRLRTRLVDESLWSEAFDSDAFPLDLIRAVLTSLALTALCLALARPQWGFREVPIPQSGVDVVVAVDVSKSMLTRDVPPDRLALVRKEMRRMLDSVASARVGLTAFAGRPTILVPLTSDLSAVGSFLDVLTPDIAPVGGTDLGAALGSLEELGKSSSARKVAVLFTDGGDLEGKAREAAGRLKGKGVQVFVVGVGGDKASPILLPDGSTLRDPEGNIVTTRLEEDNLRDLADLAGGRYLRLNPTGHGLGDVLSAVRTLQGNGRKDGKRLEAIEQAHWFLLLSLLFLIAELSLPQSVRRRQQP